MMYEPERPIDLPEVETRVVDYCEACGEPIYEFEDCYKLSRIGLAFNSGYICSECIHNALIKEVHL